MQNGEFMAAIIAPSILTADFGNLREEVQSVVAGGCKLLHLDVMDGRFVPNITFGPNMVKMLRAAVSIPFDVHLMIEEPEKYIEEFYRAGANTPGSIICVHYEACPHIHRTIEKIHRLGANVLAGCAINPGTPVSVLESMIDDLDMVLIMSVDPGFGGQAAIPACLRKVAEVREMAKRHEKQILIEVDGGIKLGNMAQVVDADILVMGSAVFDGKDAKTNMMQAQSKFEELSK